ncbi:hypothetical protein IW261DRAFT_1503381 [Armillaria novae-zelandiae]|uniref:Uncharacterized protein n=1 Tax=Armillaria novae-zelandiae TaxID=153914 RepID=A0AA39NXM5_9AGAR|nr:hypothetical protein IW261DRAFT_1503381 [Armillaria novae-zelandiae]
MYVYPTVMLFVCSMSRSIIPPVPVLLKRGCAADFWINLALCVLGWIPGVIHAWYIISKSEGAV